MDIYTRQVNCEHWPVDRPHGWNAGLTDLRPMCGGGRVKLKVVSVETRGLPDAGWLAATIGQIRLGIGQGVLLACSENS